MKIATNLSLAVQMLAFCEGVLLAEKGGIDRASGAVRGADQQRDRLADGASTAARSCSSMPEEAWFDCQHDAEGHAARAGARARARRAAADDRGVQRDPHRRARDGPRQARLRRRCSTCSRSWPGCAAPSALMATEPGRAPTPRGCELYERMLHDPRLRGAGQRALHAARKMPGLAHLYSGEEAVAVGVCAALRRDDYITSTHRGHGHCLAKGAAIDRMFAELLGQGGRLLPGQGRLDAHRRPGERQPRRERDRRRQRRHRDRRGALGADARQRPGRRLLLRRGRARPGPALRGHEHGRALEAAGRLRLREQPLQRVHALPRDDRRRASRARAEAFGMPADDGRRPGRARRPRGAPRRPSSARARGEGPSFLVCETYRYHGHHVGDIDRAYYRSREEEASLARRARPDRAARRAGCASRASPTRDELAAIEARVRSARSRPASRSRSTRRIPTPSEVDQHVYA